MQDRNLLLKRYKFVGVWIKLYSEYPEQSFCEILVQNQEGKYTFKHENSSFSNDEDQTDFWFETKGEALRCITASQLTADNLIARRYLSASEYNRELERRMQINKKLLLNNEQNKTDTSL